MYRTLAKELGGTLQLCFLILSKYLNFPLFSESFYSIDNWIVLFFIGSHRHGPVSNMLSFPNKKGKYTNVSPQICTPSYESLHLGH